MKRLTGLLVLVLLLSLCACGKTDGKETEPTATGTKSDATVLAEETKNTEILKDTRNASLSFLGCGDNIVYYGNVRDAKSLAAGTGKTYNFEPTYENVKDKIAAADLSFINQETLLCGEGYELSYYPQFNGPQEMGDTLCDIGFDIVNIANNHMLDQDEDGLAACIKYWKGKHVTLTGGYTDEADSKNCRIVKKNGIKIAFLSYTYATNGLVCEDGKGAYVPYLNEETVKRDAEAAKKQADFVFVSVHWGEENNMKTNEDQKKYAQLFADCGVDAIIGHHPHVIQPVEWLTGKNGNKTLCVYSLGNFIGEMSHDYNMLGGMIQFNVQIVNSEKRIDNPVFIPTVYHFSTSFYQNCIYLLENYTDELAGRHGVQYYNQTLSRDKLIGYLKETVDVSFLPETFR